VDGWQTSSTTEIFDLIGKYIDAGIRHVVCTDITRDGELNGPAFELYRSLRERFPALKFTASGGVSRLADIAELDALGLYGVVVGKAIYENCVTLDELSRYLTGGGTRSC
jgi:phosphoribosylformimino-5-aminoimidazole carboxamide ribotide isomerase